MNLLSHILFGLTLGETLGLDIVGVMLGAVIPDFDYLLNITHRTVMHSLLFVIIIFILLA